MIPLRDNIKPKGIPWILWLLIFVNAYIFCLELQMSPPRLEKFIFHWGVVPRTLINFPFQNARTLVSAMFLHGGWLHILFNMLFLYIFGSRVEDEFGHLKFFIFYFLVGIIANFAQAYMMPHSVLPLIGASGAIAGVLGAYFFYFPHSRIVTLIPLGFFITIREIPAFFFLGFWFLIQIFSRGGGIAWWAHAFGFIAGILMAPVFGKKTGAYR
jgi:membrane associated rhomboid family serine protease